MRYKHLFTPLGLNAHWSFRSDLWGIGTTVAGIGNMVSNLVTNHENVKMQEEINRRNIENQWNMFRAQNNRQDFLNSNQDLIKRQSLAKAGMNVNSEFGGYPNIATNNIPLADQKAVQRTPIDFSLFAQMMQQQPLVKAQARQLNADAEHQEILNERERSVDKGLRKFVLDNINTDGIPDLDGVPLDNVDVQGNALGINAGTFEAQKRIREYKSELLELDKNDVKNVLDKLVTDNQLKDDSIIKALKKMPYYEYLKLNRECAVLLKEKAVQKNLADYYEKAAKNQDAQAELTSLEQEIQENTNIAEMIHKYLGDGPLSDVAMLLVTIFGAVTGQMHFGFNRSSSKSSSNVTSNSTSTSVSDVYTH